MTTLIGHKQAADEALARATVIAGEDREPISGLGKDGYVRLADERRRHDEAMALARAQVEATLALVEAQREMTRAIEGRA